MWFIAWWLDYYLKAVCTNSEEIVCAKSNEWKFVLFEFVLVEIDLSTNWSKMFYLSIIGKKGKKNVLYVFNFKHFLPNLYKEPFKFAVYCGLGDENSYYLSSY